MHTPITALFTYFSVTREFLHINKLFCNLIPSLYRSQYIVPDAYFISTYKGYFLTDCHNMYLHHSVQLYTLIFTQRNGHVSHKVLNTTHAFQAFIHFACNKPG